MRVNGKWIYWKEQCDLCVNAKNCKYEVKDYIEKLEAVQPNSPVYGTLEFSCDYCYLDEEKYLQKYCTENSCCD